MIRIKLNEGTLDGLHGAKLFFRMFVPQSAPRGAVIAVHGHGDHSGGLRNVCNHLAKHGFITYALDLRGHGRSSGVRGFIRSWEEYRGDLHAFRKRVESEAPDLPLFIFAHSLGGVVGLDYCLHHGEGVSGLMVVAPGISYEVTPFERFLVAALGAIKPDFTVKKAAGYHLLTRDPEMLSRLELDPLRHKSITPGLGRGLMQTLQSLMSRASAIQLPVLMQFGLRDEITPPEKLRQFFAMLGSEDKQKFEYADMLHRPFDDTGREQFFADLIGWLEEQTGEKGARHEGAG